MKEPTELDIAQLRFEMRTMYSHVGLAGALQILYEMVYGAKILAEIIVEEKAKNETH
jgi:hypothetical protein